MNRFWLCLLLLIPLHFPARAETAHKAWVAAGADTASTAVALSSGLMELNPLGPWGAIAAKAATMGYIRGLPEAEQPRMYKLASSFWGGAAANNLCWLAGVGPVCALVGVVAGRWIWSASEEGSPAEHQALAVEVLKE